MPHTLQNPAVGSGARHRRAAWVAPIQWLWRSTAS